MWGIEAFLRIQCKFNAIPASIVEKGQYVQFKIDGILKKIDFFSPLDGALLLVNHSLWSCYIRGVCPTSFRSWEE